MGRPRKKAAEPEPVVALEPEPAVLPVVMPAPTPAPLAAPREGPVEGPVVEGRPSTPTWCKSPCNSRSIRP